MFGAARFRSFLARVAARHERGLARERTLAQAGAALVAAADQATVQRIALDTVRALLSGVSVTRLSLLLFDADESRIVASEGEQADAVRGLTLRRSNIPQQLRPYGARRQISIDADLAAVLRKTLGFRPLIGHVALIPLAAGDDSTGLLVVESPDALPAECADALATLGAAVALGVASARLKQDLRRQAFSDSLTGLANRACFMDCLEAALERARWTAEWPAVLFLDLDNFKVVNDSLGHAMGDQLLVSVAERLTTAAATASAVARLGGDEFTVLLANASVDAASDLADRIAADMAEPIALGGRTVRVGASVGVALADADTANASDLLRAADMALYAAKGHGKGQAAVFEATMAAAAMHRLELEGDLRTALVAGELELHYQPIVRLDVESISGVEALVRWRHPRLGLIPPSEFIALAEETGLVVPLGRWVLETACSQLADWRARSVVADAFEISVNVSARQLRHPTLFDEIERALHRYSLAPQNLKLEITESLAVGDTQLDRDAIDRLHALGVGLAIDDFGTGNSAVDYLRRFPVQTLKIDRSFVRDLGDDFRTAAVVRGMIAFARSLRVTVTAEGVETAEQSRQLQRMGCHHGQGYLFGRPLPARDVEAILDSRDADALAA